MIMDKIAEIEKCLLLIDDKRIEKRKDENANVYVYITNREMGLNFAYSDKKEDEEILIKVNNIILEEVEEEWGELQIMAKAIASLYEVRIFIDDARTTLCG